MKKPFFILIAACFCACNNPSKPAADTATESSNTPYAIKTGGNKLIKVAGKYNVWTRKSWRR
ncbi:hypothetical protein ACQ86K_02805 [Mucilaginibacter sp. P19]|uniref:hypothetical protein n=1 Tax=Mucilaginibacter sp. P19 TaxID=3423947 RepID=UPI003D674072